MEHAGEEFQAPQLSVREIVQCLQALNFNLTEKDLQKPSGATLRSIYSLLVDVVTGITKDEMEQADQDVIDQLDYPELHMDAIAELAFYRATSKLMRAAGVRDFSFRNDLLQPKPRRTQRNLSAIINFLKFREERLAKYFELRTTTDEMYERRAKLLAENDELEQQLAALELEAKQEEPVKMELREICEKLTEDVQKLNVRQAELRMIAEQLKEEEELLKENLQTQHQTLQNAQTNKMKMEARVVHSPEKLQKLLKEWTEQVESTIAEVEHKERVTREKQTRIDYMSKIDKELSQCIRRMESAYNEMEKSRDSRGVVKELQQALENASQTREEMEEEKELMNRKIETMNERLRRLKETLHNQRELSRKQLMSVEQEKHAHEQVQQETEDKIRSNIAKSREIEALLAREDAEHRQQTQDILRRYSNLSREVREYHKTLFTAMGLEIEG